MKFEEYVAANIPVLINHYRATFGISQDQCDELQVFFTQNPLLFAQYWLVFLQIGLVCCERRPTMVRQTVTATEAMDCFFENVRANRLAQQIKASNGKIVEVSADRASSAAPPLAEAKAYVADFRNWPHIIFWSIVFHVFITGVNWNPIVVRGATKPDIDQNVAMVENDYTFHFISAQGQINALGEYITKEILKNAETPESLAPKVLFASVAMGLGAALAASVGAISIATAAATTSTFGLLFSERIVSMLGFANKLTGELQTDQIQTSAAINVLRHHNSMFGFGIMGRRPMTAQWLRMRGLERLVSKKDAVNLMNNSDVRYVALNMLLFFQTFVVTSRVVYGRRTNKETIFVFMRVGNDLIYALIAYWIMEDIEFNRGVPRHPDVSSFSTVNGSSAALLGALVVARFANWLTTDTFSIRLADVPSTVKLPETKRMRVTASTTSRKFLVQHIVVDRTRDDPTLLRVFGGSQLTPFVPDISSIHTQTIRRANGSYEAYQFPFFFQARTLVQREYSIRATPFEIFIVNVSKVQVGGKTKTHDQIIQELHGWLVFSTISSFDDSPNPRAFVGVCVGTTPRGVPVVHVCVDQPPHGNEPQTWDDVWSAATAYL